MSDYGVKETQCTRCGHREVCSLKTEFLEAQNAIDEVYVSRPCEDGKKVVMIRIRDIKYIEPVELRCKHYMPNTGVNIDIKYIEPVELHCKHHISNTGVNIR